MKMFYKTVLVLGIIQTVFGSAIEAPVDYSQHKIIRILPKSAQNNEELLKLKTHFDVLFDSYI